MAEEIIKVIRVDTKGSAKTINQLKKEIKELKGELNSTSVGSAEFASKLRSLAQVQQQYASINMDMAVKTQSMEQSFKNLAQFGGNLTKSFSSISAMVGLLGGNADNANKALLKVAQTMQLVQGISGFGQMLGQLPKIIAQFKNWSDQLSPIYKRIGDIASSLNGLDTKTLNSLEKIASGNINIQANVESKASAKSSAVNSTSPITIGAKQITAVNSALGEQQRIIVPVNEEWNKYNKTVTELKARKDQLTSSIEANQKKMNGLQTALAQTTSKQAELNEAFTDGSKLMTKDKLEWARATLQKKKYGEELTKLRAEEKQFSNELNETSKSLEKAKKRLSEIESEMNKGAGAATKLGNGLKSLGKSIAWTAAITIAISLIWKLIDGVTKYIQKQIEAKKAEREFRIEIEKGVSGASKNIIILQELSRAYQKVGDSVQAKTKFIEDYADKIKETGLAIADVNTADDVFIKNTDNYVDALKARAKAQAAENLAIQKYQEYLEKRAELEVNYLEQKTKAEEAQSQLNNYISQGIGDASLGPISNILDNAQKAASEAESKLNKLDASINKTVDDLFKVVEAENAAADAVIKPLEDAANAVAETAKAEAEAKAEADKAKAAAEAAAEKQKALRDKELDELAKYYKAARDLFKDARTKELDDIKEKYDVQIALAKKYGKDTTALELARQREIADVIQKYSDQALKDQEDATQKQIDALQTQIERIRKMNDTSNLRFREQNYQTEYRQSGITSALGLGRAWKNVYQSKDDVDMQLAKQIEYNNKILALTKSRIEQENEILNQQLNVEGITADQRLEIERTLAENKIALEDAVAKNEEDNLNAYLEHQQKRQQALNATLEVASSVFGSMAAIAQASMNAEIKTEGKTTTELEKAKKQKIAAANTYATLSISQAIVDTYKAANESYSAMASIPYVGPALGAAAAGAAVIAGIANVRQIMKAAQDAKLSASASISMSSGTQTSAPTPLQTMPIEYTRNLLGDKETSELNKPIKCYVLESEITTTQNRVAVTEQNASF